LSFEASFGGSPSKIVDWGESAGGTAVDFLDLAYPTDPIVSGKIIDTTSALYPATSTDFTHGNFSAVAKGMGCEGCDAVACMRKYSWEDIIGYLFQHQENFGNFTAVPDERIVFANTTQRYEMGAFSWVPAIIGNNQEELFAFGSGYMGFNDSVLTATGNLEWLCDSSAIAAQYRKAYGRSTYRFLYSGNFTNISPGKYEGAYHASELPLVMGTAGLGHSPSTEYEKEVSRKMQDLWVAFAKDPVGGLRREGWGAYEDGKAVVLADGKSTMREIGIKQLDGRCP